MARHQRENVIQKREKTLKVKPKVSGLYKEIFQTITVRKTKDTELELRVDVDGDRPMNAISGDLYSKSKRRRNYISSFRFEKVEKVKTKENEIWIIGKNGKSNSDRGNFAAIQAAISLDSYPFKAVIKLINSTGVISEYLCKRESEFFRRVKIEHDYEEGVVPVEAYDTSDLLLPPPKQSRMIGITEAYSEAGVEIIFLKKNQTCVSHPKENSGSISIWTQNELYDAMLKHFSLMKNEPQWVVWLLSAEEYVISDVKGTMVLHEGYNRRGCAVFQSATGWQSASEKRMRLFIYIHELGHCFNLRHPWSRTPAGSSDWIDAHSTLSWMNYPWRYYLSEKIRGEEAFWEKFNFQFSDSELIHLRHGFRNDVIFGGDSN